MSGDYAKIRDRLSKIKRKRSYESGKVKRLRVSDAVNFNHLSIDCLPNKYHSSIWGRELRCRLLPWMIWGMGVDEHWINAQMTAIGWDKVIVEDSSGERLSQRSQLSQRDDKIYKIYQCGADVDWEKLELICSCQSNKYYLREAILHNN
jgi:hypothetical protein